MRYGRMVTAVWLLGLAVATMLRANVWTEEQRLWTAAIAHSPEKPRPWINLGQQLARSKDVGMAGDMFSWASELSLRPTRTKDEQTRGWAIAETNLAILAANRRDLIEATRRIQAVMVRTPQFQTPKRINQWIERASLSSEPPAF